MSIFVKFVKIDDHVPDIAEETWSQYFAEHKSGSPEFDSFLKNPLPELKKRLSLEGDYRLQTTIINHDVGLLISAVCTLITVFPDEKVIHLMMYKHP